jgi:hypothetical protein
VRRRQSPRGELEDLLLDQLDHVLHNKPLLHQAIAEAHAELNATGHAGKPN